MKSLVAVLVVVNMSLVSRVAVADIDSVPLTAAAVIHHVRRAAEQRDWNNLRMLLIREFTWSFGGDRNADQAINLWKEDARYLRELVRVLRQGCRVDAKRYTTGTNINRIKCPGFGDLSFRAGFIQTADGWRMERFERGDAFDLDLIDYH